MARKSSNVVEVKAVKGEFAKTTEVNVLRVPRLDKETGAWLKSARGNLHMDTLCYPCSTRLEYLARNKSDPSTWSFKVGDKVVDIAGAKLLAIGVGCITDTTTKVSYMVYDKVGDDAISEETKRTVLNRCKRQSTIKRLNVVCRLLESIGKTQGLSSVFAEPERLEMYNTPAKLLNAMRDAMNKPVGTRSSRTAYFALA